MEIIDMVQGANGKWGMGKVIDVAEGAAETAAKSGKKGGFLSRFKGKGALGLALNIGLTVGAPLLLNRGGGSASAADAPAAGQSASGGSGNMFADFFAKLLGWLFGSHEASAPAFAGPGYARYDSQDIGSLENGQINARTREGDVPEGYMEVVTMENGRAVSSAVPEYELGNLGSPNSNTAQPDLASGELGTPH